VKRFYTMDLPILRVEEGSGKYAGTMGNLVVDYKGNEVGVGTGFTDEHRDWFWQQREVVPGTLVEVKYKEISKNKQTGAESLQFPVFVGLRTDKSEVSYG
jgi:DNA ligase-1